MTPFEYDANPYNGWNVDGDITTTAGEPERAVVWGCERPELLITETLAWHDFRTEDLDDDDGSSRGGDPPMGAFTVEKGGIDEHFDQRIRPEGAFFVELYNPWGSEDIGRRPAEIYHPNATLDLRRKVGADPVWRLIVVKGNDIDENPDQLHDAGTPFAEEARCIYFTDPGTTAATAPFQGVFFPFDSSSIGPVEPGGYAVLGSKET